MGLGCAILSYVMKLCEIEKLDVVREILLILLNTKKKYEKFIKVKIRGNPDQNLEYYGLVNTMSFLGSTPMRVPSVGEGRGKGEDLLTYGIVPL